jgi:hypothetical protein
VLVATLSILQTKGRIKPPSSYSSPDHCVKDSLDLAVAIHTDVQDLNHARDWMRRISEFTSESVKQSDTVGRLVGGVRQRAYCSCFARRNDRGAWGPS